MSATLVTAKQTNFTSQEFIQALVEGWNKLYGKIPKKESIGVIYSQWALETGFGKYCWNYNIGNVKFVPSKNPDLDNGKQYMMLANVWEMINGQKVIFQPPNQATWFRAYPTLGDGIAEHMDFLKNTRYAKAWTAVEAGDPANFAHLLKVAGYYTASEADYTKLMNVYFARFMKDPTFDQEVAKLEASIAPPPVVAVVVPDPEPAPVVPPVPEPTPVAPTTVTATAPVSQNPLSKVFGFLSGLFKK